MDMELEPCLLCLDAAIDMENTIEVNSIQWQTQNIKFVIETHLWPMDTMNTFNKRLCVGCWNVLESFHTFYVRIKKTHSILSSTTELDDVKEWIHTESTISDVNHVSVSKKEENVESCTETEILLEQPISPEFVVERDSPLIKEDNETFLENIPLKQRRKRGRPPKDRINQLSKSNNDPLGKTKKFKAFTNRKKPKVNSKNNHIVVHSALDGNGNVEPMIKNESGTVEPNISVSGNGSSDSDSDYEIRDESQLAEISRKKRKNPDEKTRQEHDKIIAEYFKIFCSLCQIPIENFIALRKHFREDHKKRGFVICCKKKIFTRPILVDHIRFHLDPNFFKCNHCDKVYSDRCTLESHMKIHETGQQDRNHACDTCGKSFVGPTQLETHKLTHAPDYEKKFSCSDCGKFFTTLYSLNYHIQAIHHNKYIKICDICGKTMRCRNSFKLHMEKHDNKLAAPIHCDICGLRLIDRRGLRRHKNSQHPIGGKKEYSCQICSKISPNLRALRTHVRFAHETGYVHKCTMCDKAFKRPEALKEHMATHTGTPLYTCPWCPRTFISNGNMHNHRKKSHPKEWEDAQRLKYGGIIPSNNKPEIITNSTINKTL